MGERLVAEGLMWIRFSPDEKPIWVGGRYNVYPPPSIAYLFANAEIRRGEVNEEIKEEAYDACDYPPSHPIILRRYSVEDPETCDEFSQVQWT